MPTAAARLVALPPYDGVPGEFALDRERLVLGRDTGSDLALTGRGVSGRHAEIVRGDGRWLVRDLDSTNGTSVAGRPVTGPVALHDGDVLSLGDVRLLFRRLDRPQPREGFLREVAATRTTARWFVGVGLALLVAGMVAGVYAVLVTFGHISAGSGQDIAPPDLNPFGGDVLPPMAFADAGTLGGVLLIIVGIVLHVVATARRRRIDERLSVPVPRPPSHP